MFFWESESTSPTVSSEDESYSSSEEEEDGEDGEDSDEKANKLVSVTSVHCGILMFNLKCSRIIGFY